MIDKHDLTGIPAGGPCQPGNRCPTGSEAQIPCSVGHYQPTSAQSTCLTCENGVVTCDKLFKYCSTLLSSATLSSVEVDYQIGVKSLYISKSTQKYKKLELTRIRK